MLNLLLWPFRLVGSIIGFVFDLVGSAIGFVFGLVGSVIGMIFSFGMLALVIIGLLWIARQFVRKARGE